MSSRRRPLPRTARRTVATLGVALLLSAAPLWSAQITIVNSDGPGEGLNDTTGVAPVVGNPGTTLGAQRLNVLQAAANHWASRLSSSVELTLDAAFDPLACASNAAVLGSAGAGSVWTGATPVANTWYPVSLANSLAGFDLCPTPGGCGPGVPTSDIVATLNLDVDDIAGTCSVSGGACTFDADCPMSETCGCLVGVSWWYGIGAQPAIGTISLYDTVLHELGHGLGFSTQVDLVTGAEMGMTPDIFETYLEDHASGMTWPALTDMQRAASAVAQGDDELHWVGEASQVDCGYLEDGAGTTGHLRMYSPSPLQPGSSVSHWDTSFVPNELMEPAATLFAEERMTRALMQDLGWSPIVITARAAGDVNGNNSEDMAVLSIDFVTGENLVHVIDGSSGVDLGPLAFAPAFYPLDMEIVDHFGGTTADEVAVLLHNPYGGEVRVLVRDLSSGALLSTLFFGSDYEPVDMEVVRNYGDSAAAEIAVLGKRRGTKEFVRTTMRDASSGALINHVFHAESFGPIDLEVVPNFAGTAEDELAVLARNCGNANVIVDVRDVSSGAKLNQVLYGSDATMIDLEIMPDITDPSGTSADEVVVLGRRTSDRSVRVWVKDAQNGFKHNVVFFPPEAEPLDIEIVPDFGGGSTVDEIALLARREDDGRTTVKIKDAGTGFTATTLVYWTDREPRDLTVLDDFSGNNVAEIGMLAVKDADNVRRAHIRDAAGTTLLSTDLP